MNSPLSIRHTALCQLVDEKRKAGLRDEALQLAVEAQLLAHEIRDDDAARVPYRCVGGFCGAEDCSTCHPSSHDKDPDREREVAELCKRIDEIILRAQGAGVEA